MASIIDFWVGLAKSVLGRLSGAETTPPQPDKDTTSLTPAGGALPTVPPAAMGLVVDFKRLTQKPPLHFTHIIIHHSATKDGKANDWEAIRKYHMSWRVEYTPVTKEEHDAALAAGKPHCEVADQDIGYNFGIEEDGCQVVLKYGRQLSIPGAHCKQEGMNRYAVGICVVGDYDKEAPDKPHWDMAVQLTKAVMAYFNIPVENVHGHKDYAPKSCPGKQFNMAEFRNALRA